MQFQEVINSMTPEIYGNMRTAVEIGKWPDGRKLTSEQRELCLQAIIAYEAKHIPETERTGFIDRGSKSEGEQCDGDHEHDQSANPLKWMQ